MTSDRTPPRLDGHMIPIHSIFRNDWENEWEEKGGMNPNLRRTFNIYIETKDHKKVITQIKDDIELMLYNNKDLIKKNK